MIAQFLPTYTMLVFLLTHGVCKENETLFNTFWWTRKLVGVMLFIGRWDPLHTKDCGRHGWKTLYHFNFTLLAKQWWHFLCDPNALVSPLYKARFFPATNFLQALSWGITLVSHGRILATLRLCFRRGVGYEGVIGITLIFKTKDWL